MWNEDLEHELAEDVVADETFDGWYVGDWVTVQELGPEQRWRESTTGKIYAIRNRTVWVNNFGFDMRGTDYRLVCPE